MTAAAALGAAASATGGRSAALAAAALAGFGFVKFTNAESVQKCISESEQHKVKGKWVEIKMSRHEAKKGGSDICNFWMKSGKYIFQIYV